MTEQVILLPLSQITAGNNDRKRFARQPLIELAESIADQGLAQPITVRAINGSGKFEIVAGERRFRAHEIYTEKVQAGEWRQSDKVQPGMIKALVRDLSNEQAAAIMLVENTGRQDLNPVEEARAYAARKSVYNWNEEKIARTAGKSVEVIRARLALLTLAEDILEQVGTGKIPLAYAGLMTDLDLNRQRLAVRMLSSGPVSLANFRRYVMQLQEEQSQDSLFSLTELWVAQVADQKGPKNGKEALARLDLPEDERVPACESSYGTPIGDVMFRYIQELLGAGMTTEAVAVGEAYAALVRIKKACLPKQTLSN